MATHGFYYDSQKKNKKTSITLHANTQRDDNGEWISWAGETFPAPETGGPAYGKDPICSGILTEDFGVSINNNWGEQDLGNAIQDLWNTTLRPFAPYAKEVSKAFHELKGKKVENEQDSKAVDAIQKGVDIATDVADFAKKHLNYALVVQGFRFTYFNGGSTNFKNLSLRFTLFPDWFDDEFLTVHQQIDKFMPYCISEYVPFSDELSGITSLSDKAKELVTSFAAWQKPPAGFEAGTKSVDVVQKGTLRLNIGLSYCIENLVVSDCNIELSKMMSKYADENGDVKITPLYADVYIQLQPASMYSDRMFKTFTSGDSMKEIIQKEEDDLKDKMKEQVDKNKSKK